MSEKHWIRRRWKLIVNVITLAAIVILVIALWPQIKDTYSELKKVDVYILLLMIPIEALNYHAQARLYQRLFKIVGNKLSYKFLYRASLELNFINHVFPSGGVTGMSYFTLRLGKKKDIAYGKATLIHIMKIMLYFLSYEVLLVFGVFALAIMGRVNNLVILIASSLTTLLILGTLFFVYLVGSKERINGFFTGVSRFLNWIIRKILPSSPETINIEGTRQLFNDFHDNYQEIKHSLNQLRVPFLYALLADATEIAAIYVVYIAFGKLINIGAVILAYGIANFAGAISVLPGGVGVYEALMTGALASMGVPAAVSLPVTITYRVLNTLIQVPPGYWLYHRALKSGQEPVKG
ncbi:MAG TPA: lysylphosphatidylglycerol synthase transmembrane domain-containing protein [Candidatus Sulfotelmatobacter sp.]|nr:lysylphosphatidylglycerol synthase transmembrane domain-containing protein [Candidatus Sulfotelmatobacter sp.]